MCSKVKILLYWKSALLSLILYKGFSSSNSVYISPDSTVIKLKLLKFLFFSHWEPVYFQCPIHVSHVYWILFLFQSFLILTVLKFLFFDFMFLSFSWFKFRFCWCLNCFKVENFLYKYPCLFIWHEYGEARGWFDTEFLS